MAKKRPQTKGKSHVSNGEIPVVGAREPCPCGAADGTRPATAVPPRTR